MTKNLIWLFAAQLAILPGCANTGVTIHPVHRSPHFETVLNRLDLGGNVFAYADIEGDAEKGAEFVNEIINHFKKDMPGGALDKLDTAKIVTLLGLDQVVALGVSSYRDGKLFRNRAFVRRRGGPKGLMHMFAKAPYAFEVARLAPADADIVFEKDVQLKTLYDVLAKTLIEVVGKQAEEWLATLHQPIPGLSVTIIQLIEKLDTRMVGIIRVNTDKNLSIPGVKFTFPHTEILIGLDNLEILFNDLQNTLSKVPVIQQSEEDSWSMLELNIPLPGGFSEYKPLLAKQKETGRIFFTTNRALLTEYFAQKPSLETSEGFRLATQGLPVQGNSITYMSSGLVSKLNGFFEKIAEGYPEARQGLDLISALLPEPNLPVSSVRVNLPEGVYVASNSTTSHKCTLLAVAYANVAFLGVLAAVTVPAFIEYQKKAEASKTKS